MAISKINDCFELLAMITYADKLKSIIKKEFSISFEELSQEKKKKKKRNEHDERTVLILVNATQRTKIDELLNRVNKRIEEANKETEL